MPILTVADLRAALDEYPENALIRIGAPKYYHKSNLLESMLGLRAEKIRILGENKERTMLVFVRDSRS